MGIKSKKSFETIRFDPISILFMENGNWEKCDIREPLDAWFYLFDYAIIITSIMRNSLIWVVTDILYIYKMTIDTCLRLIRHFALGHATNLFS